MLFRNLRSGNYVSAANEASIALMQRSDAYEAVVPAEPKPERLPAPDVKSAAKKPRKKG